MAPRVNILCHPHKGCMTECATSKVFISYQDIQWTNVAIGVAQGPDRHQRRNKGIEHAGDWVSGKAAMGVPTMKCPGVKASIPSTGRGRGVSGLEFKHASMCYRTLFGSSSVSLTLPTIRRI